MSWWDTSIVYVTPSAMLLHGPGRIIFHRRGRDQWHSWNEGEMSGAERHWTRCGLATFDSEKRDARLMDALRRDVADLVGRPCQRCFA